MLYFDYILMGIIVLPGIIFAAYAQYLVSSTFATFNKVHNAKGLTGKQIAREILDEAGLYHVDVQNVAGHLTDHYDPKTKVVSLSANVANSPSLSALAVAAHEVGHAMQNADGYIPMKIRSAVVVVSNISSTALWPLVLIGLMLNIFYVGGIVGDILLWCGIGFFGIAVIFNLITLPVEFNASSRALKILVDSGVVDKNEVAACKRVLQAAALTYVAALIVSILNLLRFLLVVLSARGRR